MPHKSFLVIFTTLLGFLGCARPYSNPRMVGSYSGENTESILFMADSLVFHTQIVNGREARTRIGYLDSNSATPNNFTIRYPDTSPFIGTTFHFNGDFSAVRVRWNSLKNPQPTWQSNFSKQKS
jgi:hypothetical protein